MTQKTIIFLLPIFLLAAFQIVVGQTGFKENGSINCGSAEIMNQFLQSKNSFRELHDQIENQLLFQNKNTQRPLSPQAVVSLPVVVHIIHNNGAENISDAEVLAGIQHLNEAFANTGYYDPVDGVNTNIQFCLARRDPNGNPTNGITRDVSPYTVMNGVSTYADDLNVKNINRWNPLCYINIWLVKSIPGSVAGYAYLPSAHGLNVDGILVEAAFFGNSPSNDVVIIHEMGHYLGLYHTFEGGCSNSDCNAEGDRVCDTPPDQSTAGTSCGVSVNSCSTDILSGFTADQNDLTEDYMDYGNWNCMSVFTQGQSTRMNWHLNNVRSSLLNCRSCLDPCPDPVTANFSSSATTVAAGTPVNFTNTSINGVSYKWYINGVLQSTGVNFANTFTASGLFDIKLVATGNNTTLCDSSIKNTSVTVTCPVVANFTASALEVPLGQSINFINTSTGGPVTYSWHINNIAAGTAVNFSNQFNQAGTFTITLNAISAFCTSSKSITVNANSPCNNNVYFEKVISNPALQTFAYSNIAAGDGSIVIGGKITRIVSPGGTSAAIFKLTKNGNLLWSKQYNSTMQTAFYKIIQTSDGNFVAVGTDNISALSLRLLVVKVDPNGQIIWQKNFLNIANVFYTAGDFSLVETAANELVIGAMLEKISGFTNTYLLKLDAAGSLIWSKEALPASNVKFKQFAVKNNSLYAALYYRDNIVNTSGLAKLDLSTAAIAYAKKFTSTESVTQAIDFRNMAFVNNELRIYGLMRRDGSGADTGSHLLVKLDTFGTVQNVNRVRLTDNSLSTTFSLHAEHGVILKDGEYAVCESINATATNSRMFYHQNDLFNTSPSTILLPDANRMAQGIIEGVDNNIISISTKVAAGSGFYKDLSIYSSPKTGIISDNCQASRSTFANYANTITVSNLPEFMLTDAGFTEATANVSEVLALFDTENICGESSGSNCYAIRVDAPDTLCVQSDSVLISCHLNAGCTEAVNWTVSAPAQNTFRKINDTTIKILFSVYGNYSIVASLASCSAVTDTAIIMVAKKAGAFSLGPDNTLCSFSTSVLKAGPGFQSYQWYDGSNDSTNTIYTPGKYYVTIRDFCNNSQSDTINFTLVAPPAFDIGADTILCSTDTLVITAPAGFSNYQWAPGYNTSSTLGQTVKVWPRKDSVYTVTALYSETCAVLDSIKIFVRDAVAINLGGDTSFCAGDSLRLNAGGGFTGYQWNNGAGSQQITAFTVGEYSVAAKNSSGCISKDTIRILSIYPNPPVDLGIDTSICRNTRLLLNAGEGFANYVWQDNSHETNFAATEAGLYWVRITSNDGCIGSDSINIISIIDTASNFVRPAIGICDGNRNFIKPLQTYSSYLWSTGSSGDSVLITTPGNYWLQVTVSPGCSSRENFVVVDSVCNRGVYFPNAFTPNDDVYNPTFRALVYEELNYFKLEIYNRYGQKLFESNDLLKGWDGTFRGVKQEIGTYVWFCSYQLKTGVVKTQKGTVLLVR